VVLLMSTDPVQKLIESILAGHGAIESVGLLVYVAIANTGPAIADQRVLDDLISLNVMSPIAVDVRGTSGHSVRARSVKRPK
jgi:hypothetical protein